MKKIIQAIITAMIATSLIFVMACSEDIDSTSHVTRKAEYVPAGSRNITISATSDGNLVKFGGRTAGARQLLPESTAGAACMYYLVYITSDNKTLAQKLGAMTANTADDTKGTVNAKLEVGTYTMTLYALESSVATTSDTTLGTAAAGTGGDGTSAAPWESATAITANIKNKAILRATAVADLRYVDKVAFYLTANGITGQGTIAIKVESALTPAMTFDSTQYKVYVGLFSQDTDTLVFPTTGTLAGVGAEVPSSSLTTTTPTAATFADTTILGDPTTPTTKSVPSGNYNLKVTFVKFKASAPATPTAADIAKSYVYGESVIVLANQITKGTIDVPDVIAKPPLRPLDFIAQYAEPKSPNDSEYTVEFAWTDTTNKETGFEIDLMRLDDTWANGTYPHPTLAPATDTAAATEVAKLSYPIMPKNDTTWTALATSTTPAYVTSSTTFDSAYYAQAGKNVTDGTKAWITKGYSAVTLLTLNNENLGTFRESMADGLESGTGSLNMNSSHLVIQLPLEHRYVARIRAVNNAGESAYTYLQIGQITRDPNNATTPLATAKPTSDTEGCSKGTTNFLKEESGTISVAAEVDTTPYTLSTGTTAWKAAGTVNTDTVETMNLYRIAYNLDGGKLYKPGSSDWDLVADLKGGDDTGIKIVNYSSQYTTVATPGVSTKGVVLLVPDSIYPNNGESETKRSKNAIGVAGMTAASEFDLVKGKMRWSGWNIDSTDGKLYPGTAAGTIAAPLPVPADTTGPDIPNIYTEYTNLSLFANYTANTVLDIDMEDIIKFGLKTAFVDYKEGSATAVALSDTTLSKEICNVGASGSTDVVQSIQLQINKTNAKYTPTVPAGTTATDIDIGYESSRLRVWPTNNPSNVIYDTSSDPYNKYTINVKTWERGMVYEVLLTAYKGNKGYDMLPLLIRVNGN